MKMIVAIIQPEKLDEVKSALAGSSVHKMTVSRVKGCGKQRGYSESYRGKAREVNLIEKIRIEIAVNDEFVEETINAIVNEAKSGNIGDGKIFVTPLEECIRIRTGERGNEAV